MPVASVASLNAPAASTATASAGNAALGQADFMKLLMAQMQNQNPMDPQNGTEYMSQLAQFSSLQGINQLNQNFANLLALQSLTQGTGLIGKSITYTDPGGKSATGVVDSVNMSGGQVQLVINKTNVSLSQIQTIQAGSANTKSTTKASTS